MERGPGLIECRLYSSSSASGSYVTSFRRNSLKKYGIKYQLKEQNNKGMAIFFPYLFSVNVIHKDIHEIRYLIINEKS